MKKHILLIDESVTVQKVVCLTLDHAHFKVIFAKSKQEALQQIQENVPDLILVSDQVSGVTSSFPKEVEAWLGRQTRIIPPCILISSREETKDGRHYSAILKKPFSPQHLKEMVSGLLKEKVVGEGVTAGSDDPEVFSDDRGLHDLFDETFNDEEKLASETFQLQRSSEQSARSEMNSPDLLNISEIEENDGWREGVRVRKPDLGAAVPKNESQTVRRTDSATLWTKTSQSQKDESLDQASVENQINLLLNSRDLTPIIDRILEKMIPPIVEKMVNERLDHLLKDSEDVAS